MIDICENVYVINLDRRPDRWEKTKKRFVNLNSNFKLNRVSAIDYKTHKPKLNPPGLVISQSFIKTFKKIIQENVVDDKYVLILEDDVMFHKNFNEKLKLLNYPQNMLCIYLGANDYHGGKSENIHGGVYGGFAILYNMKAIETVIIPQLEKYHKRYEYDNIIQHIGLCCAGSTRFGPKEKFDFLPPKIVLPNLIIPDVTDSDCRPSRDQKVFAKKRNIILDDYSL
jgi:hypothetical protein